MKMKQGRMYQLITNVKIKNVVFKANDYVTVLEETRTTHILRIHSTNETVTVTRQALSFFVEEVA